MLGVSTPISEWKGQWNDAVSLRTDKHCPWIMIWNIISHVRPPLEKSPIKYEKAELRKNSSFCVASERLHLVYPFTLLNGVVGRNRAFYREGKKKSNKIKKLKRTKHRIKKSQGGPPCLRTWLWQGLTRAEAGSVKHNNIKGNSIGTCLFVVGAFTNRGFSEH